MTERRRILRRLDTPKGRAFWAVDEKAAAEMATWPAWKRAGINVAQFRSEKAAPTDTNHHDTATGGHSQ